MKYYYFICMREDGVNMYYIVASFIGPMRELYGWTNDDYLIKEFVRNSEPYTKQ